MKRNNRNTATNPDQINNSRSYMRDEVIRNVRKVLAEAHARMPDVPEKEVERDIQQAIDDVRRKRR